MLRLHVYLWFGLCCSLLSWSLPSPNATRLAAAEPTADSKSKPFPQIQITPLADHQAAWERDGTEVARYHFGADLIRPYVFPFVGPAGRVVTRLGHPHDPEGHSHHNGFWISHADINGINFWGDREKNQGQIVHQKILKYDDAGDSSTIESLIHWIAKNDSSVLLVEKRLQRVALLPNRELLFTIDLQFTARDRPVTFGKTPFGLVGVRVAKTMGVKDGGGTIRNSAGQLNEKEVHWKQARWVDYSGPVTPDAREGVTLFDHPKNPNHPCYFHVRDDGWMCASLTYDAPRTLAAGEQLVLRYGLYIHAGTPEVAALDARWKEFAATKPAYGVP